MNRKIALMTILMLMLPLAGCIEGSDVAGAVQTGGDDSTDASTGSVVNNYYYNNTTIVENTNTSDYKYLVFDTELANGAWPATVIHAFAPGREYAVLGEFNTTAGSMYSVVYDSYTCETTTGWYPMSECYPMMKSTCGDVIYTYAILTGASESSSSMMKGTVDSDCHHVAYASGIYAPSQDSSSVIRLHYEIGFKQIPALPY